MQHTAAAWPCSDQLKSLPCIKFVQSREIENATWKWVVRDQLLKCWKNVCGNHWCEHHYTLDYLENMTSVTSICWPRAEEAVTLLLSAYAAKCQCTACHLCRIILQLRIVWENETNFYLTLLFIEVHFYWLMLCSGYPLQPSGGCVYTI